MNGGRSQNMPKPFDKDILKKRIVEARNRKGLSQAQVAGESGVTPAAVSQIESGRRVPTIPVLHRIATVLGVSIDYLTGQTDKPELEDLLQQEEVKTFFRGFQSLDSQQQKMILENRVSENRLKGGDKKQ